MGAGSHAYMAPPGPGWWLRTRQGWTPNSHFQAGLKEHRIGSASVSRVHGNFLVVETGGAAGDVIRWEARRKMPLAQLS